jgi:hypothetical protein
MTEFLKIALPHSQPVSVWDRAAVRLTDWHLQFYGMEKEEGRLGWQWTWKKFKCKLKII